MTRRRTCKTPHVAERWWRWWFEDRRTGRIVIAQFPNWPIWAIAACWLARMLTEDGSTFDDVLRWAVRGLWLFWGADELARGVNPWRRLLGASVLGWQLFSVLQN